MTDLLTPLIDAYRAENPPTSLDSRALRTRILLASSRRHQSSLRRVRWLLLPVAAAFMATASFAAPTARPALTRLFAHLTASFRASPPPTLPRPRLPASRPSPTPALSPHPDLPRDPPTAAVPTPSSDSLPPAAPALSDPLSPAPAPDATPGSLNHRSPKLFTPPSAPTSTSASTPASTSAPAPHSAPASAPASALAPTPASPPPPPAPDLSPDLSAYRVAHRLHFEAADYARALLAWNGYLTRFASGTFAPEARLNRAVCLARLGRTEEARAALSAIASGQYGSYGRDQAERLLEVLPPPR